MYKTVSIFLFVLVVGMAQAQPIRSTKTEAIRDTIPASIMVYGTVDSSEVSIIYIVRGYEIYEDSLLTEYEHVEMMPVAPDTVWKDTIMAFSSYMSDGWIIEYLNHNKKPFDPKISIWASKPDRSCDMHPPRGL